MVGSYNPVTNSVSGNYGLGGSYTPVGATSYTPVGSTSYVPGSLSGNAQHGADQYYSSVLPNHFSGQKLADFQQLTGLGGVMPSATPLGSEEDRFGVYQSYSGAYQAAYNEYLQNQSLRQQELAMIADNDRYKAQQQANLMNQSSGYPAGSSVSSGGGGGFGFKEGMQMVQLFAGLSGLV